jgi:hypothetical protein
MKWYLLTQLAFWIQQIFTVNIEERRKDFYHMLSHHVLTSALLSAAYIYRFYNVANVVLSLMDIVDFLLPVSEPVYEMMVTRLIVSSRQPRFSNILVTKRCAIPCLSR